jgi:hypothetical protein
MSEHDKVGMKDRKAGGSQPSVSGRPAGGGRTPQLNSEIQAKIGQQLRKIYDDMVNQGVPDRFADLINRIDEQKK